MFLETKLRVVPFSISLFSKADRYDFLHLLWLRKKTRSKQWLPLSSDGVLVFVKTTESKFRLEKHKTKDCKKMADENASKW